MAGRDVQLPALTYARLQISVLLFLGSLTAAGLAAVHTPFGPGPFPFAPGFHLDRRWGGLVRFLDARTERPVAPRAGAR